MCSTVAIHSPAAGPSEPLSGPPVQLRVRVECVRQFRPVES